MSPTRDEVTPPRYDNLCSRCDKISPRENVSPASERAYDA